MLLPGTDLHLYLRERQREQRLRWLLTSLLWAGTFGLMLWLLWEFPL